MTNRSQIPASLSAVSSIFLILAVIAVTQMVYYFMGASFRFELNILGFWIYFGLRRFSAGWRTCALVLIWMQLIVLPIMFVFSILNGRSLLHPLVDTTLFALEFWMYRVLTTPVIRSMFYDESPIQAAGIAAANL